MIRFGDSDKIGNQGSMMEKKQVREKKKKTTFNLVAVVCMVSISLWKRVLKQDDLKYWIYG